MSPTPCSRLIGIDPKCLDQKLIDIGIDRHWAFIEADLNVMNRPAVSSYLIRYTYRHAVSSPAGMVVCRGKGTFSEQGWTNEIPRSLGVCQELFWPKPNFMFRFYSEGIGR